MSPPTPRPDRAAVSPEPAATVGPLLLAGDWHGNGTHAAWTIDEAARRGADRVFQLGDFGYWEHQPPGVAFLDGVERHASEHGITVYFLDGNHDKTSLLLSTYADRDDEGFLLVRPHVRYAPRGHRWQWGVLTFIALGGAYSVDKQWRLDREESSGTTETLWFPEEQMTDVDLDGFLADPAPVDVLLSHDKPRNSKPSRNRKTAPECLPNQDRIQRAAVALQPRLMAHGHLHFRYTDALALGDGVWCAVEGIDADPTTAMGARPDSVLLVPLDTPPERPTPK